MKSQQQRQIDRVYKRERLRRLRANPQTLSQERLKDVIHYDADTGLFTRVGLCGSRVDLIGAPAGGPTSDGYWRVAVDDVRYKAHRLAWFYVHARWPDGEIDHIDGNPLNNAISNLREATSRLNKQNRRKAFKNGHVPYLGVSEVRPRPKSGLRFRARIDGIHLGTFATAEEAHSAYVAAKRQMHEGCTL